jgi:hypothetical protein
MDVRTPFSNLTIDTIIPYFAPGGSRFFFSAFYPGCWTLQHFKKQKGDPLKKLAGRGKTCPLIPGWSAGDVPGVAVDGNFPAWYGRDSRRRKKAS